VNEVVTRADAFVATDGVETNVVSIRTRLDKALVDIEAVDSIAAEAVETIALKRSDCICAVGELAARICIAFVDVFARVGAIARVSWSTLAEEGAVGVCANTVFMTRHGQTFVDVLTNESVASVASVALALKGTDGISTSGVLVAWTVNTLVDVFTHEAISAPAGFTSACK
jgi:hypothetical protein